MTRRSIVIALTAAVVALGATRAASADPVCETDEVFDLSNIVLFPFWQEVLGAGTLEGTIVNTRVDVTFTASGTFDASDISVSLGLPVGGGAGVGFTGAELGWSGQGTFTASFESANLNGELLIPDGSSWYSWFVIISNTNPGNGPTDGNFDDLRFTLTFGDCPPGDLDGDFAVGVTDLLLLLASWGDPDCSAKTPCDADLDEDGDVDTQDLLLMLAAWGEHFV